MKSGFFLLVLGFSWTICWCQSSHRSVIQGIRLTGSDNGYSGNVQLLYNDTWGTICDSGWGISDARVACRMLGFAGASCATSNAYFGRTRPSSVPIWINYVFCRGTEQSLDQCSFSGWGLGSHFCFSHTNDAGVICSNGTLTEEPDVSFINATTRGITISWLAANTSSVSYSRQTFRIQYNSSQYSFARYSFVYPPISSSGPFFATLINLNRATTYSISVRHEVVISGCSYYSYSPISPYSDPITATTASKIRPSNFEVRLIPAISGLNFTGRVEVNYNNSGWGTVCDYLFSISDANVICGMLGYDNAVCTVSNAQFGRGTQRPIWLNRLSCSGADEILDDCTYRNYSDGSYLDTRSCRSSHYDDAGVICQPEPEDFLQAPEDFNISLSTSSSTTIRLSWKRYTFPFYLTSGYYFYSSRRFRIDYTRSDRRGSRYNAYPSYTSTSYFLSRIPLGITINATIKAQGAFRQYSCRSFIDGAASDTQSITTVERPPSTAPLNFHVSVVNCTAIMAEWDLPSFNTRNGIIRGFKLFYKERLGGDETTINLSINVTEYIIENLKPSTSYVVSVLAYTIGDGPRSIHLTATTNTEKICQTDIIDFFGINGNDLDRFTVYSYNSYRTIRVFCGSSLPNVLIDWFFPNGTKVGISNLRIREGHYQNGTSELTIGHIGRVTVCDGGIYTCRANRTSNGHVQQRTFKLTYNRSPPTPLRPVVLKVNSYSIVVKWPEYECDGGHDLQFFNIRLRYSFLFFGTTNRYINGLDANLSNYTITGLSSSTTYYISIEAVGKDNTDSSYSPSVTVLTLPPAPTPPGSVSVKLVTPNTILVNWTRPSVLNAEIAYYTVYATPFISRTSLNPRTKRQADSLQVVSKNFSKTATSGNVTLPHLGLEYHVQVSVTVLDSRTRINRESLFSALGPNSTLFVPIQGLPAPTNVRISESLNTSLTVSWSVPSSSGDTITGYLIEYSGVIDGRSQAGTVLSYSHNGNTTVSSDATSFTIQPLVPQTSYLIKVSALTNRGEGMQVPVSGTTANANSVFERYVYFQARFGPVFSCSVFRKDLNGQEDIVRKQILQYLRKSCNCGFTDANVLNDFFFCGQQDHEIIYRAHILGTNDYSAISLVEILQNWIQSGKAYVTVNNFRMQLDPTCSTRLDTLDDLECTGEIFKPSTQIKPSSTDSKPNQQTEETNNNNKGNKQQNIQTESQSSGISASTLGGLFIGLIIALLLVILIVLIIIVMFWKLQKSKRQEKNGGRSKANTNRDSMMRFAELENSGESIGEEKFPDNFN